MFTWMRTHQRTLMLVITILTIISFVWLYSAHDPSQLQQDEVLHIYDRNVGYSDFQRAMRKLNLAISLGLTDYAGALSGGNEENAAEFAVNAMIIEHEGRKLELVPDDADIENAIAALPAFQTDGQFDPQKYELVFQAAFAPQGFSRREIDEIVRNSVTFDRIRKLLDTAPATTNIDATRLSRAFQPVNGVAVLFDQAEYLKNATPTDAKVDEYFKENAARFMTPEWRTAKYVRFPFPADIDKLEGKAKIDAQQKVAEASDAFASKAAEIGFDKAAQAAGLKVETTPPFSSTGSIKPTPGIDLANAAAIAPVQALAPVVFALSEQDSVSRVVQEGNEFLVAELGVVEASRPMTLAEAKPQIVQGLTANAAAEAMQKGVQDAVAKIRAALKDGKPIADAARGFKTKPFTNILLVDDKAAPEDRGHAAGTLQLEEGELSGAQPGETGVFAVWLEKRLPVDRKKYDELSGQYTTSQLEQRRELLWRDWIAKAQEESGLKFSERGGQG
jgi:peptidyl-prolyl cis-trans isomerase D